MVEKFGTEFRELDIFWKCFLSESSHTSPHSRIICVIACYFSIMYLISSETELEELIPLTANVVVILRVECGKLIQFLLYVCYANVIFV